MHKTIKELFPDYIVLIKIGSFYESYGADANILSFLFSYKIRVVSDNVNCGFPVNSLNRILSVLERKCINYLVVDRSHNYEEEIKENFKRKNKYNEILKEAKKYIDKINRIEKVKNYLMINDSRLLDVEKLLYEQK